MKVLLDTNIVLRMIAQGDALHGKTTKAISLLEATDHQLFIVPQVLYEFWVVATRPRSANGGGCSAAEAKIAVRQILDVFPLLHDTPEVFTNWLQLVGQHQVLGKLAHDTRLVAAMMTHGVKALLTFNTADFARFDHITALSPVKVVGG